jgi:peptidoglycan/xylan/chitin deacetylase (PgdA/CDA1 family)
LLRPFCYEKGINFVKTTGVGYGGRGWAVIACVLALAGGCRGGNPPPAPSSPSGPIVKAPSGTATPDKTPGAATQPGFSAFTPSPKLFVHGDSKAPRVALTFDAGSEDKGVPIILKTLQERHLRITFFLTGRFCQTFPDSSKAIADAGMEMGNHTWAHPHITKHDDEKVKDQLFRAEEMIVKTCGRGTKPLFRFPYGDEDKRTRTLVAENGWQGIHWTLDSLDSVGEKKSSDFVAERIIRKIKPGYIVLMHVSRVETAEALPRILDYLEQQGIQVVPVSELLLHAETTEKVTAQK